VGLDNILGRLAENSLKKRKIEKKLDFHSLTLNRNRYTLKGNIKLLINFGFQKCQFQW
jgi:hypothetical protein